MQRVGILSNFNKGDTVVLAGECFVFWGVAQNAGRPNLIELISRTRQTRTFVESLSRARAATPAEVKADSFG